MVWAMSLAKSFRSLCPRAGRPEATTNSVCTSLGLICMTRMLCLRSSARQHSVNPDTANLLAAYAVPPAKPLCPAVEATLMMLPRFCSMKCRADSRATSIAPNTFVANTRCMSASCVSMSDAKLPKPALLIKTS